MVIELPGGSGIVHEDVHRCPEGLLCLAGKGALVEIQVFEVYARGDCRPTGRADQAESLFQGTLHLGISTGFIAADRHHFRTLRRKAESDTLSNSSAGPRDDGDVSS